jgi:hypothetical protein
VGWLQQTERSRHQNIVDGAQTVLEDFHCLADVVGKTGTVVEGVNRHAGGRTNELEGVSEFLLLVASTTLVIFVHVVALLSRHSVHPVKNPANAFKRQVGYAGLLITESKTSCPALPADDDA